MHILAAVGSLLVLVAVSISTFELVKTNRAKILNALRRR